MGSIYCHLKKCIKCVDISHFPPKITGGCSFITEG